MPESEQHELHESNRRSWNAATAAHNSHKRDQGGFLCGGGSTLFSEEIELLGDLTGRTLVHLQCNSGQDTLCLARLGAMVTGVDISDEAIDFARKLAADTGIEAAFHRADVYDWFETAQKQQTRFDIVFCSYGSICWLSDLVRWARGVAAVLHSGGRFVIVDFHPVSMIFNERFEPTYPYFGEKNPLKWDEGVGDYVALSGGALAPSGFEQGVRDFKNPHPVYEYQWPIATLLEALLGAGLRLERFCEYPYSNAAQLYENMREEPGRRMYPPESVPSIPLMYGLVAVKP